MTSPTIGLTRIPIRSKSLSTSQRLKNKLAIVTGGSSGIGRAIAKRFATEGAYVVIADITENPKEGGDPTADVIVAEGGHAVFQQTDISIWKQVDRLFSASLNRHDRLDILVNNAATYNSMKCHDTSEDQWDLVMDVNLKGTYFCSKRAIQQMLAQDIRHESRGRIVNISSQHGMISAPSDFAYGVSKAGVVYMTRQIAADYATDNIICNAVAPGKILTGAPEIDVSTEGLAYSNYRTPMPRLGKPDDVASAAVFLASDEASYMTGVNLMVDGGWTAA